jgi:RNA polymerase sigma factor (sigma-70 family)
MFRLCFRYLRSREEAEEVMIGGFMKVFEHLHRFEDRGLGSLDVWIRRIMVNECLMLLRKYRPLMVDAAALVSQEAQERTDSNLDAEDLYELICSLPTGYRTVFNLYVIEGYSHKEIAGQLQISESTSKSQLSRARALMQQLLQEREAHYVQR